ncbi:hypothetical protein [Paenibacillus validus]|uniref:hypothetical protein n=1 Tax=Paenibacillus validus TaxID=44253 RepID=UPI003D27AFDE
MNQISEAIRKINRGLSTKNSELVKENANRMLQNAQEAAYAIQEHYNDIYNVDNGGAGITSYLKESLIREIMQNILDCSYEQNPVVRIEFVPANREIVFRYNETGFQMSDVISFLSQKHTSKDSNKTGAFGIGAKGAILSAEFVRIESLHREGANCLQLDMSIRSIEISNLRTIQITELLLSPDKTDRDTGTIFTLRLAAELYEEVKQDLSTLVDGDKGKYLTPVDLIFAAVKKPEQLIKIKIGDAEYSICCKIAGANKRVTFSKNEKGVSLDLYQGKRSMFEYLLPALRLGGEMPDYIHKWRYNLFSTYELTGQSSSPDLPVFYINIPTTDSDCMDNDDEKYYVTSDRKGIQDNKRSRVEMFIAEDVEAMILATSEHELFIETQENGEPGFAYRLFFLFDFIDYKRKTANADEKWDKVFTILRDHTSVKLKDSYIRLRDFKVFNMAMPNEKDIPKGSFIFVDPGNGRHRKSEYSKFIELKHRFDLVVRDEEKLLKTCIKQYDQYEENSKPIPEISKSSKLLNELNRRDQATFALLSAEVDRTFTQETLAKLMQAIKANPSLARHYDGERKLTVGGREYLFANDFVLTDITLLAKSDLVGNTENRDQGSPSKSEYTFRQFLLELFQNHLLRGVDRSDKLACIKRFMNYEYYEHGYVAKQLTCTYDANQTNQLKIKYNSINLAQYDVSDCQHRYQELREITRIENPSLFENSKLTNYFSVTVSLTDEYQDFDVDTISRVTGKSPLTIRELLDKIVFIEALRKADSGGHSLDFGKEIYVMGVKDDEIQKIRLLSHIADEIRSGDLICLLPGRLQSGNPKRVTMAEIAKLLDGLLQTCDMLHTVYKKVDKPIVKLYDQFSPYWKPRHDLSSSEFEVLKSVVQRDEFRRDAKKRKMYFTRDLSNKLFGYSTSCSICDYESNILNTFMLKESIPYNDNSVGKKYALSLYVCANHYYETESFSIIDIRFGENEEIAFGEWLQYLEEHQKIPADYLKCTIHAVKRVVVQTVELYEDDDNYTTAKDQYAVLLTPLMAAKWYMDNY